MIDYRGRILDNEHIDRFVMTGEDKLKSCHTQQELINALNLVTAEFDSDSKSKDFSAKDLASAMKSLKDVVTIYDTDKIKGVKKDADAITEKLNPKDKQNEK